MKFYSEVLNKTFDSPEACESAEKEHFIRVENEKMAKSKAAAERKAAAKQIEELLLQKRELEKEISAQINDFCSKHGAFHYTVKEAGTNPIDFLFDSLFDRFI